MDKTPNRMLGEQNEAHQGPAVGTSFIAQGAPLDMLAKEYMAFLLAGNRHKAGQRILEAVQGGVLVRDIYLHVFQPTLYEIGRLWQRNEISVAEEHFFTAATQLVMSQLYPYIFASQRKEKSMMAACVGDELHEVGVRMVADFFEMDGWNTWYLGANVPSEAILQSITTNKPDVLALSATMSYHARHVQELIAQVRTVPGGEQVAVLVGGWCFRMAPDLWKEVGADGFASDAGGATLEAERALAARRGH